MNGFASTTNEASGNLKAAYEESKSPLQDALKKKRERLREKGDLDGQPREADERFRPANG